MKTFWSSKLTMGCMAIFLATGQAGGCSDKQETVINPEPNKPTTETLLRGIPLGCYVEIGPKGIHPSVTSSLVELVNFQSAQWAEVALEYAKNGDVEQAIALTEKIEDDLTKNETLVELAGELAARGDYERAKQLVAGMRDYEMYRAKGLARIGRYYTIADNNQAGTELFSEAIAFTNTLDADYIQPIALAEIAIEYAGAGQLAPAMQIVEQIKDETSQSSALAGIASELAQAQQLTEALDIVARIADEYYQAQALTEIAKTVTTDRLSLIVANINRIEDDTNKKAALAEIVMLYIRLGEFDRAAQLTQTLIDDSWLLPGIIAEYAAMGQIDRITALTNAMDANKYWQNRALIEMTSGYAASGDFESALEFANGINSPDTQHTALMAIAQHYVEAKQYRQALDLFQKISAIASNDAISYDIDSYFAPLVNCAIAESTQE